MLRIWGRRTSSNVQALMWCVGEIGLAYERYDVGHVYGGNDTEQFLAMNPNGTVPVIKDGDGEPLWETGAVLRYLCDRYGQDPFWPDDSDARTKVDMWAEWAKINVALAFTAPVFWRVVRTAPRDRDVTQIKAAIASLSQKLDIAEQRLQSRRYLMGDDLTLADIQIGHVLYRYFDIEIDRPDHAMLRQYYERLTQRSAFREHVMVPYDELRVD